MEAGAKGYCRSSCRLCETVTGDTIAVSPGVSRRARVDANAWNQAENGKVIDFGLHGGDGVGTDAMARVGRTECADYLSTQTAFWPQRSFGRTRNCIASYPSHGRHRLFTITLDMHTLRRGLFFNTVGAIGGGGRFSLLSHARARETSFSLTRSTT